MNFGVIGTSWISESFIKAARYLPDAEVVAVYSRSEEKGSKFAVENKLSAYYTSLNELLSDTEIDAIYIASPNSCHFHQAKMSLLSGKHVLCEKPAVVTSSELSELLNIAKEKNLIFSEAMKSMHSEGLPIILNELKNIGAVKTASIDFSQLSSKYPAYKRGENPNIFNTEFCTGALMDLGVYCVYFALELFGKPDNIISHSDFFPNGSDFCGTLIFSYHDKTVTITYSKVANGFLPSKILGENGAITVKSVSKLVGIDRYYNNGKIENLCPVTDENIIMSEEIAAFISFVNGKNLSYYDYCGKMSLDVCSVMETIRKQNNFRF